MDPFENSKPTRPQRFQRAIRRYIPQKKYGWYHSPCDNMVLSIAWVVSGLVAVLGPLIFRTIHTNKYKQIYLSYYWEEEYQAYEEQRKQNYEQYGNNYNYGGAYMYDGSNEREWVDVNNCKWWQFNCFSFFANREGEAMPDQEWYPTWFSGFTQTEEDRQEMEANLEQPGPLKFVYAWQIIMFIVIGWYGMLVIRQNRNPTGLIVALLVWANFAFISMWLMADGSIITDGQQVKRTGFYGQMSVLIFMSNFWYFLHGLVFVLVFWIRASCLAEQRQQEKEDREIAEQEQRALAAAQEKEKSDSSGYKAPVTQQ
jgi:hypothetical protein